MAGWHFVNVGKKQSEEIQKEYGKNHRGFGSLPILITLGKTIWKTSIFPCKEGSFILPIKVQVRKKENVFEGDTVTFSSHIR